MRRELKSMSAAIVKALSPNLDLVRTSGVKSTVRVTVNLRVHEDDLKLKKTIIQGQSLLPLLTLLLPECFS